MGGGGAMGRCSALGTPPRAAPPAWGTRALRPPRPDTSPLHPRRQQRGRGDPRAALGAEFGWGGGQNSAAAVLINTARLRPERCGSCSAGSIGVHRGQHWGFTMGTIGVTLWAVVGYTMGTIGVHHGQHWGIPWTEVGLHYGHHWGYTMGIIGVTAWAAPGPPHKHRRRRGPHLWGGGGTKGLPGEATRCY